MALRMKALRKHRVSRRSPLDYNSCAGGGRTEGRARIGRWREDAMVKRAHVRALLLACIPVAVSVGARATVQPAAQDGNRTDRLTLDQYLEMETVSDPQLSPDGTQI